MKAIHLLILPLLVCAALLGAGCTTAPTSATPAPGQAASTTDLALLALTPSDVPQNFTLVSGAARNPADVGSLARNLGWEGGYTVKFTGPAGTNGLKAEITQSIARYPAASIPNVMVMADTQDRTDTDLEYTNITMGTAAFTGRGFVGKAPAELYIKPVNANPIVAGSENHDVSAELKSDVAEIIFSKGNILEVIRMSGPGATMESVTSLAEKAYAKIP